MITDLEARRIANDNGWWMLILSGGPYAHARPYRVPMYKDKAKSVAADFRRRIGCSVSIVRYEGDSND